MFLHLLSSLSRGPATFLSPPGGGREPPSIMTLPFLLPGAWFSRQPLPPALLMLSLQRAQILEGEQGQPHSRCHAQKTAFGGLCASPHPFPDSSCPAAAPSILDGAGLLPADPRAAASCPGPTGPADYNIPSRSCFLLVWEQGCVAEPAGCPATCVPMGLRPRLQHRT